MVHNRKRAAVDSAALDFWAQNAEADGTAPVVTASLVLVQLRGWADAGWLRRLDVALAHFVHEQDPQAAPCVLVAAALLAQMEGRGHSCMALETLVQQPQAVLGWTQEQNTVLQDLWQRLPLRVEDWVPALQASPLVRMADEPDAGQPLVLAHSTNEGAQLYLRRYWDYERLVAAHIMARSQATDGTPIDAVKARQWLDRFFPTADGAPLDWQKLACAMALRGRFTVITGGPGTGKTYTAARLLALLFATAPDAQQLRVALAAPTGKAAARLKQSIDNALKKLQDDSAVADLPLEALVQRVGPARTLHALLGARPDTRHFKHYAGNLLDVDVLIVDEVSMVHLEMMHVLLEALPAHARLVLLGDKDQLASVEAGAVLGDLCRDAVQGRYSAATQAYAQQLTGQVLPAQYVCRDAEAPMLAQHTVMLRHSRRFDGPIGALATAVNTGDAAAAHRELAQAMQLHGTDSPIEMVQGGHVQQVHALALQGRGAAPGYGAYAEQLRRWPQVQQSGSPQEHEKWVRKVLHAFERFRLLCAVREGEWGVVQLNTAVEKALEAQRWIRKSAEWYMGRPVMVTRNDAALGVFNGDIGIALPSAVDGLGAAALRVYFSDGDTPLRSVGVARLAHVETAFAMTVHKSQGSEFEHTCMVLSAQAGGVLGRELVYTGITRAQQYFTLMAQRPGLLADAVVSPTRRTSGLLRFLGGEWQ